MFCWRNWYMYDMICNIKFNCIVSVDKKCEFVRIHSLWSYIKYLISLNINNLSILHCNDPLVPKWWSMWLRGIGRWRNLVLLLETVLIPTLWASIVLIKNLNMSYIDLLSLANYLYMDGIHGVHTCACIKSSLHLIWNLVWHLCRRRIDWHTILFVS